MDRYYSVSRAILIARALSAGDVSGDPLVKEPYNVSQEIERKHALSMVLSQTKQQERKDAEVLAEAKRIYEARMAAKGAEETELPVTSNVGQEATERPQVYTRTYALEQVVQAANSSAGLRTIKRVEQTLQDLGVVLIRTAHSFLTP